jgi:hypothetical protein
VTEGEEDVGGEEMDHLIVTSPKFQNRWGMFLRALMLVFLLASVISIFSLIGKEWYILSQQVRLS